MLTLGFNTLSTLNLDQLHTFTVSLFVYLDFIFCTASQEKSEGLRRVNLLTNMNEVRQK